MKSLLKRFVREEEGQDLIEYALLVFLIAIVCVTALSLLGPVIAGVYDTIRGDLT